MATTDGFELAERDLEIRGEGQLLGARQSGLSDLRFTRLRQDTGLLERARAAAAALPDEGLLARRGRDAARRRPSRRIVRIIAGERRGARIAAPKGTATRPTGDRVREAAYNLIGPVDDAAVLDLFAGSGAMGLEALSRGARRCVFVESDRAACAVIRGNLEKLRLTGALVLQKDAFQALREERAAGRTYDLVLVDPPYGAWPELEPRLAEALPSALDRRRRCSSSRPRRGSSRSFRSTLVTSRRYGSARITLFTR